jgi:uncharacterized protein (DUF488 family)
MTGRAGHGSPSRSRPRDVCFPAARSTGCFSRRTVSDSGGVILTIGHSTRTLDELIVLLRSHGATAVADIRTIPQSRRHPQFSKDSLSKTLPAAGIDYRHFPGLGGLRKPRPDSTNTGWRHRGFRGYADYMQTPAFSRALGELVDFAKERGDRGRVALMCAEAVWWRCHRQLVADALLAAGWDVRHVMSASAAPPHELTAFARRKGETISYPGLL